MSDIQTSSTASTSGGDASGSSVDPIEVNGGESAVTFDDLERVESQAKAAKKAEKDQVKETVKETVKALDKSKGKDEKPKDESKKADDSKEDDEEGSGEKKKKPELEKSAEKEKKSLKGKLGDEEVDLDPETVITVKVNGQDESVSLKDLQNNYSGKISYDRKFSELNRERQQFQTQFQKVSEKIDSIFNEEDPELRFFHMAELAGKDPVQVRQKYLEENMNLLERYYAMSEDERKADAKEYENRILKHQLGSKQKEEQRRQTETALQSKITDLGKTHQFSEDEFWTTYDQMKSLKTEGKFQGKLNPEAVAEVISKERLWSAAESIIAKSEALPAEKRGRALMELVETAHLQGLGPKEIREIAEELWGQGAQDSVIDEKIQEQELMRTGKKSTKKADYIPDNEVMFFDQI